MKVTVEGKKYTVKKGITFQELYTLSGGDPKRPVMLAFAGDGYKELFKTVPEGADVRFVDSTEQAGYDTLRRSMSMLFMKAVRDVTGIDKLRIVLHFSVGDGFYYTVSDQYGSLLPGKTWIAKTEKEMRKMIKADLPFKKEPIRNNDARKLFLENGMEEKARLFRYRIQSWTNIYDLDGFKDYNYGFLAASTGNLGPFKLVPYDEGVILQMRNRRHPDTVREIQHLPKLFGAQLEGEEWARQIGIDNIADLNDRVTQESVSNLILLCEAQHERRISEIAGLIAARPGVKFIMIAGPSSSGKTTSSQRLCIQLAAHGLTPHYLGVDNYFLNREDTPLDENGKKDFESLRAIDVEKFGEDMTALLKGETIDVPVFNFAEGKREYRGEKLSLPEGDVLVIEGIHCLNEQLSYMLPSDSKFRIFISALTQLNIDDHDRLPTTDGRLLRRMIRDHRTRGFTAAGTLAIWDSVRKGEEDNIFPYQESADVFFNSALPYELAVLKTYAEPLLYQIREGDPEYPEAQRLLKFLKYVIAVPADAVPANSILREFIGGGCFRL